jgi:hypothetical protein
MSNDSDPPHRRQEDDFTQVSDRKDNKMLKKWLFVLSVLALATVSAAEHIAGNVKIPTGSTIHIAPIEGLDTFLVAAFRQKGVELTIVNDRAKADFELTGNTDSQKSGWARTIFLKQTGSNEEASIQISNIKSGEVVFGYAVHKSNSVHGKQSTAEACAKHLKEFIRKGE